MNSLVIVHVEPHGTEMNIGRQAVAFNRLDFDEWVDEC